MPLKNFCHDSAIPNSLAVGLTLYRHGLSCRLSRRSSGFEPWRTKRFSLWNYFTGGSGISVAPESASGSGIGLNLVVVDAQLSGNKRGKSVVKVPFLTASLLG